MKNFKTKVILGLALSIIIIVLTNKYSVYQYIGALTIIASFLILLLYLMKLYKIYQKNIDEFLKPYLGLIANISIIFCIVLSVYLALYQGKENPEFPEFNYYLSITCRSLGVFGVVFFAWFLFKVVIPISSNKNDSFIGWFENKEQYDSFIELLKSNSVFQLKMTYYEILYSKRKEDSLAIAKAAIIRRANEEKWFKKVFLIKDLKKMTYDTFENGHSYLDRLNDIRARYSSDNLDFLKKYNS